MCGFAGVVDFRNERVPPYGEHRSIEKILVERGPDEFDSLQLNNGVMYHSRLSIIGHDIASQPYAEAKGDSLVFNGEVYNFKKLAAQYFPNCDLCSRSDTIFLYHFLRKFGAEKLTELEGMFAFVFHKSCQNEILAARDPIGEKPLYYAFDRGVFSFGSSTACVKVFLRNSTERLNAERLVGNFLSLPEPMTKYHEISKLRPGHFMRVCSQGVKEFCYWKLEKREIEVTDEQVIEKLEDSVSLCHVSDVDLVCLFSGGIDSSLIPIISKKHNLDNLKSLYHLFSNSQEWIAAKSAADRLGLPIKRVDKNSWLERNVEVDEFFDDIYTLPTRGLMSQLYSEIGNDGYKVALTGNGADEIFYGYNGAFRTWIVDRIRNLLAILPVSGMNLIKRRLDQKKLSWLGAYLTGESAVSVKLARLREEITSDLHKQILESADYFLNLIETDSYLELSNYFGLLTENSHSITLFGDVPGMLHSVEARSPFLNHKLVELTFNLPVSSKISPFYPRGKKLLRRHYRKELGSNVLRLRKYGFAWGL